MSGIFIALLWSTWIISTFILNKKNHARKVLSGVSLLSIIFLPVHFSLGTTTIHLTPIFLTIISCIWARKLKFWSMLYFLLSCFIVAILYAAILFVAFYDPVWFFLTKPIVFAIILFLLAYILFTNHYWMRMTCCLIGVFIGECMYAIVLYKWNFPLEIGDQYYMQYISMFTIVSFLWSMLFDEGKQYLSNKLSNQPKWKSKKNGSF